MVSHAKRSPPLPCPVPASWQRGQRGQANASRYNASTHEQVGMRRAFTVCVLLPGSLPGVILPEVGNLLEIKAMLAERDIEWTQEWMHEGKLEGEASLLSRFIVRCFGPLSTESAERLNCASTDQLEALADRILDAETLDAVFNTH